LKTNPTATVSVAVWQPEVIKCGGKCYVVSASKTNRDKAMDWFILNVNRKSLNCLWLHAICSETFRASSDMLTT